MDTGHAPFRPKGLVPEGEAPAARPRPLPQRLLTHPRRGWLLLVALVALVGVMLATLVWLARGYELDQVQRALDRDNADAVAQLRAGFGRNLLALQGLGAQLDDAARWDAEAAQLLRQHPEWARLEWRQRDFSLRAEADSPYLSLVPPDSTSPPRSVTPACTAAQLEGTPVYASSRFVQLQSGGAEQMDLCVPLTHGGRVAGYLVASYTLPGVLHHMLDDSYIRRQQVSFTEPDGTRLAIRGGARRGTRIFTSQQLLDLPGNALVLRMDGGRAAPDLLPNVMTALVTGLSVALVTVLILLSRDFRRRQQAETALADALAQRKAMEDSLVTGLRARDLQGRITYVNPAFCDMVGYSLQELLASGFPPPYWPPDRVPEYQRRREARRARGAVVREGVESEFQRKDGRRFPVLVFEAPLVNAQGQHAGWMSAVLDITEQRRAEELSRATQERLQATARLATVGEMASLLSHELNQPLAAISSYATGSLNLLGGDARSTDPAALDDVRVALGRIAEQAGRAGRVINSVHDFVRRREQAREALAPARLLDAVMPLVQLQARKLGVRVHTELAPGVPPVWCDRTMVEQVLLNLARNGMQAMADTPPAQRELTLGVQTLGRAGGRSGVEFSVADRGCGIPPAVAERLFTPFFTTKPEGMGLGLSMCRTVIEQHGGALLHAPQHGGGTCFRFTLPMADLTHPESV